MKYKRGRVLTELELEIMRHIWGNGKEEVTVGNILEGLEKAGRPLAPPSVRKMLSILQKKGYVTRRPLSRRWFAYRAVVSAEQAQKRILKDIVERAFDGSAMDLMAALLGTDIVSRKDLGKARQLIEQRERGRTK